MVLVGGGGWWMMDRLVDDDDIIVISGFRRDELFLGSISRLTKVACCHVVDDIIIRTKGWSVSPKASSVAHLLIPPLRHGCTLSSFPFFTFYMAHT